MWDIGYRKVVDDTLTHGPRGSLLRESVCTQAQNCNTLRDCVNIYSQTQPPLAAVPS